MFDTIVKILLTLAVAGILIAILPISPFRAIIETVAELPYLGYLNWFFPVGRCGIYYGISWILRQLDIIGG